MKTGTFVKVALGVLVAAGATYTFKPELFSGILPSTAKETPPGKKSTQKNTAATVKVKSIVAGQEWTDCAGVKTKVAAEILQRVGNASDSAVADFVQKAENRLLLAQWVVADAELRSLEKINTAAEKRSADLEKAKNELMQLREELSPGTEPSKSAAWNIKKLEEKISLLETEQKYDYSFAESAAGKGGSKLMERICSDPEWLWHFAFSGECVCPGTALAILKKISAEHKDLVKETMVRDIATATALEYARSGWNQQDAVERAGFYIKAWKDERLNTVFDTLPMWQRRAVCGSKGNNPHGSVASLQWSLDNMHIPADRYTNSCWRCSYRLNNVFGDSIHGPLYYTPFETALGNNRQAMTYHVGGVCGGLSHFATFSAVANGIPAMTAGEPGHCSFVVLVGDNWTPGYSLNWRRSLHWQVYYDTPSFTSLQASNECFSGEQKAQTTLSNAWRVLGGIHAAADNIQQAVTCYEKAATAQPRNLIIWREWMEALNKSQETTPGHWCKVNEALCTHLVPIYPELGYEICRKGLIDGLAKNLGSTPARLQKEYLRFWQSIKGLGPMRWHIEKTGDMQLAAMGLDGKDANALCSYYAEVLKPLIADKDYGPALLAWGTTLSEKLSREDQPELTRAMIKGMSSTGELTPEQRLELIKPIILAAEQSNDMASFQAISKLAKNIGYKNSASPWPAFKPFPGKLASEGGLIRISSTSGHDSPHQHAGVLTPEGGVFHTGKDDNAWVQVELPRTVNVTGVVIVATPRNQQRLNNMKIQVSEDGKTWQDVHQFGPCKQRVLSTDLGGKLPVAKYVRILRPGKDFFHLNGIFVYGNQAA